MTENQNIWNQDNLKKIIASVHHYSATDKEFRKLCLSQPKKAIEKIAGEQIPEGINIKFLESDPKADFTYLLPDLVSSDELSDTELAHVSGGRGNPIVEVAKIVIKPIQVLEAEATQIAQSGSFDPGIICAVGGVIGMPPGTGVPSGTGMAASAISKAVDSDYGQRPA